MRVSIVIVNWNSGMQLSECLQSIAQICYSNTKYSRLGPVIVVDNASHDGSADKLDNSLTDLRVIRCQTNLGFGAACNLGAKQLGDDTDLILFLNPDTRLFPDSIDGAVRILNQHENNDVGVLGIALRDDEGKVSRSCTRFPTLTAFAAQSMGLDRFWPRLGHFMREWPHDTTRDVDHVIGAFYLIRRPLFLASGGFDERFFVYLEDLDLSLRIHQLGWRRLFTADVEAYHRGGGTSHQIRGRRLAYSLKSRLKYAEKHFAWWKYFFLVAITWTLDPVARTILLVTSGRWRELGDLAEAYSLLANDERQR